MGTEGSLGGHGNMLIMEKSEKIRESGYWDDRAIGMTIMYASASSRAVGEPLTVAKLLYLPLVTSEEEELMACSSIFRVGFCLARPRTRTLSHWATSWRGKSAPTGCAACSICFSTFSYCRPPSIPSSPGAGPGKSSSAQQWTESPGAARRSCYCGTSAANVLGGSSVHVLPGRVILIRGDTENRTANHNTYPTRDMHRIPTTLPATPARRIPTKKGDCGTGIHAPPTARRGSDRRLVDPCSDRRRGPRAWPQSLSEHPGHQGRRTDAWGPRDRWGGICWGRRGIEGSLGDRGIAGEADRCMGTERSLGGHGHMFILIMEKSEKIWTAAAQRNARRARCANEHN